MGIDPRTISQEIAGVVVVCLICLVLTFSRGQGMPVGLGGRGLAAAPPNVVNLLAK